jgi:hypothetical protein
LDTHIPYRKSSIGEAKEPASLTDSGSSHFRALHYRITGTKFLYR